MRRYVPVAEYEFGICYYGEAIPHKTIVVKADNLAQAANLARTSFISIMDTTKSIVHIATRPNPEYAIAEKEWNDHSR